MRGNLHMPAWFDILGATENDMEDEPGLERSRTVGIQTCAACEF